MGGGGVTEVQLQRGGWGRDVSEAKFLARKNTNNPKHKLEREFGFNCYFYFFNKKDSLEKQSFNS